MFNFMVFNYSIAQALLCLCHIFFSTSSSFFSLKHFVHFYLIAHFLQCYAVLSHPFFLSVFEIFLDTYVSYLHCRYDMPGKDILHRR